MHITIWERESFFASQDVIIAGGGLVGLWCAYELLTKHPSLNLLILDSGIVPTGASTRNAGFACFGSPTELMSDAETMGEDGMWQLVEMRYKGIQKIRAVLGDAVIGYDDCGGYECLRRDSNNIEKIGDKLVWLNKGMKDITGKNKTFAWANEILAGYDFQGFDAMIENKLEGGLHSGKLVMALGEKVRSLGGRIMTGIEVISWEDGDGGITVFTKQDLKFKTSKLLICTSALSKHLCHHNAVPARGQIIVTEPIDGLPIRGTFHFDAGFYYFRNVGNRVLLGGARNTAFDEEATTSFETTPLIQDSLENFLYRHILKNAVRIEYRWSGIMGFTEDKQPLVKQVSDNVTAMIICNGMGVALAPVMAEKIAL